MSECMYIVAHKKMVLPDIYPYKVIYVGEEGKDKLGTSIEEKNKNYAELTALYWIWKNAKEHEIIGMCHYRRYFYFKNNFFNIVKKIQNDFSSLIDDIEVKSLEKELKNVDIILPTPYVYSSRTIEEDYQTHHRTEDVELMKKILIQLYPSYKVNLDKTLALNTVYYYNMFVMRKKEYDKYMEWLFNIFFEMEKYIKWPRDSKQDRVFGFLAERMLNIYVHQNNLSIKEVPVVYMNFEYNKLLKNEYKGVGYYFKRKFPESARKVKKMLTKLQAED